MEPLTPLSSVDARRSTLRALRDDLQTVDERELIDVRLRVAALDKLGADTSRLHKAAPELFEHTLDNWRRKRLHSDERARLIDACQQLCSDDDAL